MFVIMKMAYKLNICEKREKRIVLAIKNIIEIKYCIPEKAFLYEMRESYCNIANVFGEKGIVNENMKCMN